MVPVSIRTGDEEDTWTNRVSGLVVDLPTNVADPLERVARCREAMEAAKQQFELVPAEALVDIQQYSSPVVATSAIRLAARLRLADRIDPVVNVDHLQRARAAPAALPRRRPARPVHPGVDDRRGHGPQHHRAQLPRRARVRADRCRELVPDLWHMVDLHIDEIDVLFEASGREWAAPPKPAPPRGRKKAAAKKAAGRRSARRPKKAAGEEGARAEERAAGERGRSGAAVTPDALRSA